MIFASTG